MASSASASVSSTLSASPVLKATAAGVWSVPSTVTVNADAAGTEPVSRSPSKVTVSVAPFTAAEENAGGVSLVTDWGWKDASSLPERSLNRLAAGEGRTYCTVTVWRWSWRTALFA